MRLKLSTVVAFVLCIPAVMGCSMSYLLWAIRTKPADPLFRFLKDGKAGYIDSQGKIVVPPTLPADGNFDGEFHEGLLLVKEKGGPRFIDRSGATVVRPMSRYVLDFSEGLAPAEGDDSVTWGFIDRTGQFAIKPQFRQADAFSEGLARVSVPGGSVGYIDKDGNFAIPPRLDYGSSFHEGLAMVILEGPCQAVQSNSCARPEYRPLIVGAHNDCRYSFIDKTGKPIPDARFVDAKDFSEGLAPVRIGSKWGYIDKSGRVSIAPQFDSAEPFSEGLASVAKDKKVGFIDHSGAFVIPPQFEAASAFSEGLAVVSQHENGNWAAWYIDKAGKTAFPGKFAVAESFIYGLAPVEYQTNSRSPRKFAWIDTSGKVVFRFSMPPLRRRN